MRDCAALLMQATPLLRQAEYCLSGRSVITRMAEVAPVNPEPTTEENLAAQERAVADLGYIPLSEEQRQAPENFYLWGEDSLAATARRVNAWREKTGLEPRSFPGILSEDGDENPWPDDDAVFRNDLADYAQEDLVNELAARGYFREVPGRVWDGGTFRGYAENPESPAHGPGSDCDLRGVG